MSWRKDKPKDADAAAQAPGSAGAPGTAGSPDAPGTPGNPGGPEAQMDAEGAWDDVAGSPGAQPGDEGTSPLDALRAERDDFEGKYKRVLADYHNSQRRAAQNERDARQRGVEVVVESVITALDHFETALAQDAAKMSAEQLLAGVRLIQGELIKAVQRHGGGLIEPKPNDEFDPMKHQAVARHAAPGVEPGRVVQCLQTGYTLGERTIRPAMVMVAPSDDAGAPSGEAPESGKG